jgi:hypothetical protein
MLIGPDLYALRRCHGGWYLTATVMSASCWAIPILLLF